MIDIDSFSKLLQLCLSPIALISGAGLILLSITNRLGRSIDRSRDMVTQMENSSTVKNNPAYDQLKVLIRRSHILRNSVFFTACSIFLSTLMILGLIFRLFLGWECEPLVLGFMFFSVFSLCAAMAFFLIDIAQSLRAVDAEVKKFLN